MGTSTTQGGRHLMFLQGGTDLAKIPAHGHGHILHQPSALPQPGFLLLTVT